MKKLLLFVSLIVAQPLLYACHMHEDPAVEAVSFSDEWNKMLEKFENRNYDKNEIEKAFDNLAKRYENYTIKYPIAGGKVIDKFQYIGLDKNEIADIFCRVFDQELLFDLATISEDRKKQKESDKKKAAAKEAEKKEAAKKEATKK